MVPSPAATLRFLRVVDEREEERARARSRYLGLMRKHIENQLQQFMEREQLLTKRKERKEKKEKVSFPNCILFYMYLPEVFFIHVA